LPDRCPPDRGTASAPSEAARTCPGLTGTFFASARPPALVDRNESPGGRVCRPEAMGELTLSRLYCRREFPMRRFPVFALVAMVSLAGGLGLAFGQRGHPQPGSKSQATKPRPPAPPGKRPPSKFPPSVKKSPSQTHRPVGPKGKSPHQVQKGPAKGGKGSKGGAGGYSSDDYKR